MKRFLTVLLIGVALSCFASVALAHGGHEGAEPSPSPSVARRNTPAAGVGVLAILVAGGAGLAIYRVIRKGL